MSDREDASNNWGMKRALTPIETKVMARDEKLYTHSFWLEKLGFHDDPKLPGDATDEQRYAWKSQISRMIGAMFAENHESRPKMQRKFYIGKPTEMSVDFLRHYAALVLWAEKQHLMVGIEEDGRIYMSSSYFYHDDPNRSPHGWMTMTFDGLAMTMGEL